MPQAESKTQEAKEAILAAIEKLKALPRNDLEFLLTDPENLLGNFLLALGNQYTQVGSLYDYLLENKVGLMILARLRDVITRSYSFKGKLDDGKEVFVSPYSDQWFDDGVLFLQGNEVFEGLLGLYQNGEIKFGVMARAVRKGEIVKPEDLIFISPEDAQKARKELTSASDLESAVEILTTLLNNKVKSEAHYQDFLTNFPWAFGAQYSHIDSHKSLDDKNIPDFSGVRIRDNSRDIFEIKSPFLPLFRANDDFAKSFNDAWNQVERYLDFVRREAEYLFRQKNLLFENPHCFLIIGKDLSDRQIRKLRTKERMNPAITIITYDDLLTFVKHTAHFIRELIAKEMLLFPKRKNKRMSEVSSLKFPKGTNIKAQGQRAKRAPPWVCVSPRHPTLKGSYN